MKINLKNRAIMLVKLVVLLFSGWTTSQAATISYTTEWETGKVIGTSTDTDNHQDILNSSTSRSISQFDPALGILQSININFSGMSLTGIASAGFREDVPLSTVEGHQKLDNMALSIAMPSFNFTRFASTRSSSCTHTKKSVSSDPLRNFSRCFTALDFTANLPNSSTSFGPLSSYIGLGIVKIDINQDARLITDETNGGFGYVDYHSADVSTVGFINVTYDYTVVPVPAAFWLFCSGLIGLVEVARRKKISN